MAFLRRYKWSWIVLGGFTLYFCFSALIAPFWGGNDTWSDLLPVVHYQNSILKEHRLPLYTEQWYGGREQWKNPLWNFLYLPATILWLILPLDWATKIVLVGHLVFSLFAGWKLASLFLVKEIDRISAAIIFVSPSLPAYLAGHIEKILSWGWILLALYFLLDEQSSAKRRGLGSGICLGIVPLTGSNYYTLYGMLLLIPLLLAIKNKTIFRNFVIGAVIGLLHLPSVAYMIGVERANAQVVTQHLSLNIIGILSSLIVGVTIPLTWETWGLVGVGVMVLFIKLIWVEIKTEKAKIFTHYDEKNALIVSLLLFLFFTSGLIYRFNHLFDTFRVPARAIVFVALTIFLYCLIKIRSKKELKTYNITFYLAVSAIQIILLSWMIRPMGSVFSYDDHAVKDIVQLFKGDHARSVWINNQPATNMNIDIALTQAGFHLPNVYYGDMGQEVPIYGETCGYAFDHILSRDETGKPLVLRPNNEWQSFAIGMPDERLEQIARVYVDGYEYKIYRVVCK